MSAVSNVIQEMRLNFFSLQEIFDVSEPLKIHIIFYHYKDYLEKVGSSLLNVSDECTEAVHSRYRMFEERHGYQCNQKGTPGHRNKQHKSVTHFNSLYLGDFYTNKVLN